MAEMKTAATGGSVDTFMAGVDPQRRQDCERVLLLMREATGAEPRMWGDSIVGFGTYHYRYESGREGDWFLTGFSPRKNNLTLYVMAGFDRYDDLLGRLGKHTIGKSCLHVKRLSEVDETVLRELIVASVEHMKAIHAGD
jgi:hypothetical protein